VHEVSVMKCNEVFVSAVCSLFAASSLVAKQCVRNGSSLAGWLVVTDVAYAVVVKTGMSRLGFVLLV